MTEIQDDPTPSVPGPATVQAADWQPLPRRGALLYAAGTATVTALSGGIGLGVLASQLVPWPRWQVVGAAVLLALLAGAAFGRLRHRRIGWKLDAAGFATRRGGWWRQETLVPVSRVQHLDLERGPLERQLGLATLVVHTAGTRMAAVKLPLLALDDAEALRAHLARQVEADDAL